MASTLVVHLKQVLNLPSHYKYATLYNNDDFQTSAAIARIQNHSNSLTVQKLIQI